MSVGEIAKVERGDARATAARALLQLIGYGPDKQFPHPDAKYREALAVVDALKGTEHMSSTSIAKVLREHRTLQFNPQHNGWTCATCGPGVGGVTHQAQLIAQISDPDQDAGT